MMMMMMMMMMIVTMWTRTMAKTGIMMSTLHSVLIFLFHFSNPIRF